MKTLNYLRAGFLFFAVIGYDNGVEAIASPDVASLTCGETEANAFRYWTPSWLFTPPHLRPPPANARLAPELRMRDGVILRGVMIPAATNATPKKALLILYGNVSYSDRVVRRLQAVDFFDPSFDSYVYDYRGYWRSNGVARFRAIVDDFVEVVQELARSHDEVRVYGMSMGSIIATRASQESEKVSSMFLDGIVSRLSDIAKDCPPSVLDPVDIPDAACKKVTLLVGEHDRFFSHDLAKPFIERMKACGNSRVTVHPELGHAFSEGPFFKGDPSKIRATIVREWLAQEQ